MSQIHPSLKEFAIPVEDLESLDRNPRRGNVEAIMASYEEFGQIKPIVARKTSDGRNIVIAGNHQLEAARRLGWGEIAVVFMEADEQRALAFAVTENRTNELGFTDTTVLYDVLETIVDDYGDLMLDLGWDEFEMALMEPALEPDVASTPGVYLQPIIQQPVPERDVPRQSSSVAPVAVQDEDGEVRLQAPSSIDARTAVTTGASSVEVAGSSQAVVQYSLVFEGGAQQKRWFDFVRWLRSNPELEGETTSARLLNFLENVAEF